MRKRLSKMCVVIGCAALLSGCGTGSRSSWSPGPKSSPTAAVSSGTIVTPVATPPATATPRLRLGHFVPTGSLNAARDDATATMLRDGRVLIVGGWNAQIGDLASAELYDPHAGTFASAGSSSVVRSGHTATLLADGRVLIAGGDSANAGLFDPAVGTFTPTGSMTRPRRLAAAVLLRDGRVLIMGGEGDASAELYDPATGTFTGTGSMSQERSRSMDVSADSPGALLLPDGRVLVVGMRGAGDSRMTEIYDPATGKFTGAGRMSVAREAYSATLLADGRVLVAGGLAPIHRTGQFFVNPKDSLASAEVFDPGTGEFARTGSMIAARFDHGAVLLDDGLVLVIGGEGSDGALWSCELYDPATGRFGPTGSIPDARARYAVSVLADGRVLLAGGSSSEHPSGIGGALVYQH